MKYMFALLLILHINTSYAETVLKCSKTEMVNLTKQPWNKHDMKMLKSAETRCGQLFYGSPCVMKFIKKPKRTYNVICGMYEPST